MSLDNLYVMSYISNWTSPKISPDTYRLYGRKTPANEATRNLVETIRSNISHDYLRENSAIDDERIRLSHNEWTVASEETSRKLDKQVKESLTVLFFKCAIFELLYML